MAKYTKTPVVVTDNPAALGAAINENLDAISDAIEDGLSRSGELPNQMEADLDMNSNHIINVADPVAEGDAVNLRTVRLFAGNGGGGGGDGSGGVSDHGLLTGLTDDDHPQYFNIARGDARFVRTDLLTPSVNNIISNTNISTLLDVSSVAPVVGEVLKWNGFQYVNAPDSTAGGGAAANLSTAYSPSTVSVNIDTGTDAVLNAATGSLAGVLTAADKTKLDGIAAGATNNLPNATLQARANHTGTQLSTTISDFNETVEDIIGTRVVAGTNVTVVYNDTTGTTTISSAGGGGGGSSITQLDDVPDVVLGPFPATPVRQFLARDWTDPTFSWRNETIRLFDLGDTDPYSADLANDLAPFDGKALVWDVGAGKFISRFPSPTWEEFPASVIEPLWDQRFKVTRMTTGFSTCEVRLPTHAQLGFAPPDSPVPRIRIGDQMWFYNDTPGSMNFVARPGATIEAPGGVVNFPTRYTMVECTYRAPNVWAIRAIGVGTSSTPPAITVSDEGSSLTSALSSLNFTGAGVTATNSGGAVTVTIPGGGGAGTVEVRDEGTSVVAAATVMNFTGAGVTASNSAGVATINIPGGGGGGSTTADITHNNGTGATVRTAESKHRDTASLFDFGAVGNDSTDNAAAFAAAQASSYQRIYVPEGVFFTTSNAFTLTKHYYGPGRIRTTGGDFAPGRFTWLTSRPTGGTGSDVAYFFSGDSSKVETEYFLLGSNGNNLRKGLLEPYYESVTTPHFSVFNNFSGWSGVDCKIAVTASSGATSFTVNNSTGLTVGQVIAFADAGEDPGNQVPANSRTITAISGNVVTVNTGIAATYPANTRISSARRTMNPFYNARCIHRGGGDLYSFKGSIDVSYAALPGQDHIFYTATGGIVGGDVNASADGVFLTAEEYQCNGGSFDVGAVGAIWNLNRNNATGARGAFWVGAMVKSEGTAAVNSAFVGIGKFNVGLDFAQQFCDFGVNKCAIGIKANDRIYFNNSSTPQGDFSLIGNVIGNSYMTWNGSSYQFVAGGGTALVMSAAAATFNGAVQANSTLSTSANVQILAGNRLVLNGASNTSYIDHDAANDRMRFFTGGVERMRFGAAGMLITGTLFATNQMQAQAGMVISKLATSNSGIDASGWAFTSGAGSINSGSGQAVPANAQIYLPIRVDGTDYWIPAFTRT